MTHKQHAGTLVTGASAIAAAIVAGSLWFAEVNVEGWLLAARYTARWSFAVFLAAYLGPAIVRGFGEARTRTAILAFGAVHGIHLGALVTYRIVAGETPPTTALAVGGLAYALIVVLVVAELRRKSGRVLRAVTLHYALAVFVVTYAARLSSTDQYWVGVVGVAMGAAALVVRCTAGFIRKSTTPA